jgi:hypothetical protein
VALGKGRCDASDIIRHEVVQAQRRISYRHYFSSNQIERTETDPEIYLL